MAPAIWAGRQAATSRAVGPSYVKRSVRHAERVTTGLTWAPETGPSSAVNTARPNTAAGESANSCAAHVAGQLG